MHDNGHTVELDMDTPFEIELHGDSSAGFSWHVREFDSTIIKQIGQPKYSQPVNQTGTGLYTFDFHTVGYGKTYLILNYGRPSEPPVKTFRIKIISGTMGRILGK